MSKEELNNLPMGWEWAKLGDVCLYPQYGWTTKSTDTGKLKYLRTTDITPGHVDWSTVPYCVNEPSDIEKYLLQEGDIVISRAGSVGYSLLIEHPERAVFASYLIRFQSLIDRKYVSHFLKSPAYWDSISERSLGIAVQNVNATRLKGIDIPISPLPEQHRIVNKIECLFAEVKTANESLEKIPLLINRFRQSVLVKASRGELVPQNLEDKSANILLEKIREERRKKLGKKYKEPELVDTEGMPELPEGWFYSRIEPFVESMRNGIYKPAEFYNDDGTPCLRMYNIEDGKIIWKDIKYMDLTDNEISDYRLEPDDLLINRVNSRELVGKSAVIPDGLGNVVFESKNIRVRLIQEINPKYVNFLILTRFIRDQIEIKAKQTVGMATVSQPEIKNWIMPIPPLPEQHRIVAKIEELFNYADQIEQVVQKSKKRADKLEQAILAKAFRGELVSQDPNDEPASVLLERIKAERG